VIGRNVDGATTRWPALIAGPLRGITGQVRAEQCQALVPGHAGSCPLIGSDWRSP
jgi:hypothetical protein